MTFTGAVSDSMTGLYYMNARHYDPDTGRFLQQDTYKGSAAVPWTQHLYVYTGNNPVNMVDTTGHSANTMSDQYASYEGWNLIPPGTPQNTMTDQYQAYCGRRSSVLNIKKPKLTLEQKIQNDINYKLATGEMVDSSKFISYEQQQEAITKYKNPTNWPNGIKITVGLASVAAGAILTVESGGAMAPYLLGSLKFLAASVAGGAANRVIGQYLSTGSMEGWEQNAIDGGADGIMWGGTSVGLTYRPMRVETDFFVTPSGDVIPAKGSQFNENLGLMKEQNGKYLGNTSTGPVRVRIENGHAATPGYSGNTINDHLIDHIHIERRLNGTTGGWGQGNGNNYTLPQDWLK